MYSQHNEESIILEFFNGRIGKYLDVGAFDGVNMSNTLALAELGWKGTLLEPSPWVFERLQQNYFERKLIGKVRLLNAALVPDIYPDAITFFETYRTINGNLVVGKGVGSFSKEHIEKYTTDEDFIETTVKTIKIKDLFIKDEFNFINIDVESFSLEILCNIPWNKLTKLEMICIEADFAFNRYVNYMTPLGWKLYMREHFNLFFVRA